jgi:hypothetical protein
MRALRVGMAWRALTRVAHREDLKGRALAVTWLHVP